MKAEIPAKQEGVSPTINKQNAKSLQKTTTTTMQQWCAKTVPTSLRRKGRIFTKVQALPSEPTPPHSKLRIFHCMLFGLLVVCIMLLMHRNFILNENCQA